LTKNSRAAGVLTKQNIIKMNNNETIQDTTITKSIDIKAPALTIWRVLTTPDLMKQWIIDSEISITSEWKVGSPILIQGDLHGLPFENKGTILQWEPSKVFEYNYWTSLSQHADIPEHYIILTFRLNPIGDWTTLTITLNNVTPGTIWQHLNFYWNTAIDQIRKLSES
jgi:uncharacterized protein YndB with AHSA1/START domain